ncbi:MAG: thiolase family protein [Candidatus Marinimicrobia bacterium]|nr:thiolase family protein [Candidatus Neomarinimicrobiota bacterium]
MKKDVFIVSGVRTPIGAFQGSLSSVPAPKLGAVVVKEAIIRAGISPHQVNEVIMGCVLPAGLGQAPARQAALVAGLPNSVECLTINKMCGSGLKAIMLADQAINNGDADIIVAGGMENMSQAPYLLPNARDGYRLGHGQLTDSVIKDGLWDVYNDVHMGNCAELCAKEFHFTREDQDNFAERSYKRAQWAQAEGLFADEIIAVEVPQRKGDPVIVDKDDEPRRVQFDKMRKLRPAFDKEGTVTAANASKINDGAAACVIMSADKVSELGVKPIARILAHASGAHAPEWFTTAPSIAMKKALAKANMTIDQIDLFEINEAFSVVTMAAIREFDLDPEKVNVNGGAVSLGHPIGASGARIMATLLNAMNQKNARYGMVSICIGGGEASAVIVEKM